MSVISVASVHPGFVRRIVELGGSDPSILVGEIADLKNRLNRACRDWHATRTRPILSNHHQSARLQFDGVEENNPSTFQALRFTPR